MIVLSIIGIDIGSVTGICWVAEFVGKVTGISGAAAELLLVTGMLTMSLT